MKSLQELMTKIRKLKKLDWKKIKIYSIVALVSISIPISINYCIELSYKDKIPFLTPLNIDSTEIPIRNDKYGKGHFGARRNGGRKHTGIDIEAPIGADVFASKGGYIRIYDKKNGYGKHIRLYHNKELMTLYAHLLEFNIKDGQRVRQGQLIGKVGKTGNANSKGLLSHLHFEVLENGIPKNPEIFLLNKESKQ